MERPNVLPLLYRSQNKTAAIVTINTQARRIGIMGFLCKAVADGNRTIQALLAHIKLNIAGINENFFKNGISSGNLTTRVSSLKHYLNLLKAMELVSQRGNILHLTSLGNVVSSFVESNPYPIPPKVKVAFFYTILRIDRVGCAAILAMLNRKPTQLKCLVQGYQSSVLKILREQYFGCNSSLDKINISKRIRAIEQWTKPEKYAEHLVHSRVNWLYDLDLIKINKKRSVSILNASACELFKVSFSEVDFIDSYAMLQVDRLLSVITSPCTAIEEAVYIVTGKAKYPNRASLEPVNMFLLCAHPQLILDMHLKQRKFFEGGVLLCNMKQYKCVEGSRTSQSFIVISRT